MSSIDDYRQLATLAAEAQSAAPGRLVELAQAAVLLQPSLAAGSRADLLLDSVREALATEASDPKRALRQLTVDLRELSTEAARELARLDDRAEAQIKATLRWVGPPESADDVVERVGPGAASLPNPAFPPPSRFETVVRIGDPVARGHLDGAVGAALRQLPELLGEAEGAQPPARYWGDGRLEVFVSAAILGESRDLALSAPVAARLAAWGATLTLNLYTA